MLTDLYQDAAGTPYVVQEGTVRSSGAEVNACVAVVLGLVIISYLKRWFK